MRSFVLYLTIIVAAASPAPSDEVKNYKSAPRIREEETIIAVEGGGNDWDAGSSARLKAAMQKHTLDIEPKAGTYGFGLISALAIDYKAKYGEALPIFVNADLAKEWARIEAKNRKKAVPGLPPSVPPPLEPEVRLGGKLHNVPLVEILRYYANGLDCDFKISDGMIIFQTRQQPATPKAK